MENQLPPESATPSAPSSAPPVAYDTKESDRKLDPNAAVVRLRGKPIEMNYTVVLYSHEYNPGLPFSATEADVREFFGDIHLGMFSIFFLSTLDCQGQGIRVKPAWYFGKGPEPIFFFVSHCPASSPFSFHFHDIG